MTSGMYRRFVPAERRRRMIAMLEEHGTVSVAELEEKFGISAMTARRDLAVLEERGLVSRTWGGATVLAPVAHEDSFTSRRERAADVKRRLADAARALVKPNETLFVDSSSTAWYFVERLAADPVPCTLITNSLAVIDLAGALGSQVDLVLVGGILRAEMRSTVGPAATEAVRGYFADRAVLSVHGVAPDGTLTDPDPHEAAVKAAMIAQAREPVLLVDATKFGVPAQSRIAPVAKVKHVIGADLGQDAIDVLVGAGVELHDA
jgi:DeoR/GlpR family transcriptional regulator of sugar metabolism